MCVGVRVRVCVCDGVVLSWDVKYPPVSPSQVPVSTTMGKNPSTWQVGSLVFQGGA